jgi:hypothetical protein
MDTVSEVYFRDKKEHLLEDLCFGIKGTMWQDCHASNFPANNSAFALRELNLWQSRGIHTQRYKKKRIENSAKKLNKKLC